jgi:hypothetical protein
MKGGPPEMDIETIVKAPDAGFDVDQVAMLERLVRGLIDRGITDEAELFPAALLALRLG